MAQLSGSLQIVGQDLLSTSADKTLQLGAQATTNDGRFFRYTRLGAVAAVPGNLYQASAEIANHQNLAPTADTAIGAKSFTVTLGATAATANQYADGYAIITTSTGAGYAYKIKSNPAASSAATMLVTLDDSLLVAIVTASSKVDLVASPYLGAVINPATATSAPIGAAVFAVTLGQYGWLQVSGAASLLADGAVVVGTSLAASNGTAGAVEALAGVQAPVATALTGIATTQYGAVNLQLS